VCEERERRRSTQSLTFFAAEAAATRVDGRRARFTSRKVGVNENRYFRRRLARSFGRFRKFVLRDLRARAREAGSRCGRP
jgi:hypothetical protein